MGIRPAVIAIGGACAGFVLTRAKVDDVLSKVEFNILIFFSGLFVTVGGVCGNIRRKDHSDGHERSAKDID